MKDVMLDIETLGTRPTSMIVQIGACYFDRKTGQIGGEFSVNIKHSFDDWRFTSDPETVQWWQEQSQEAYDAVFNGEGVPIERALFDLAHFLKAAEYMWSHATFDIPILTNSLEICSIKNPVHYRGMRDIRTLMDLAQHRSEKVREGIHHNALDDCRFQVAYVVEALNKIKI